MTVNLFDIAGVRTSEGEHVDTLLRAGTVTVERIVSAGHRSPGWYDQEWDEWVAVLQGKGALAFDDGSIVHLGPGDAVLLRAHRRHRVEFTSTDPPCIWLAVHLGRPL